jgi:CRP/FNR family transcriptional regulator, cyclic AMP receptor protein
MFDLQQLKRIPLFSALSASSLEKIAHAAIQRAYQADEMLLLEGDPCTAAYFINSGEVRVFRMAADGREQVLARLKTGQAFNTVPCLLQNDPEGINLSHSNVRALTPLQVLVLLKEDYRRLLLECPDFAFVLLQNFAGRLAQLTDLVEDLSLHSVRGRLARFLLDQASEGAIAGHWTQDEIAEHLGTVRDVVGRTLRSFQDAGYIHRERQLFLLDNREGLEREAEN